MTTFFDLPPDLPVPQDDGAADHLVGMNLPHVSLLATTGQFLDVGAISGLVIIYAYPLTGRPGVPLPEGWDEIPGARGCTPQTCAYRDHYAELRARRATVFGLSTQTSDYQQEMTARLEVPFAVLSDHAFALTEALQLPTFEVAGMTLLKRLTIVARDGVIIGVHYPVFPSNADAAWVLEFLASLPV
jgi:peroxiredoxin